MNNKIFSKYCILGLLATLLTGCYDDTFGLYDETLSEGEVLVSLEASFEPFANTDLTRSVDGGEPGDALKDLDDLCLLLYDKEGNLMDGYPMDIDVSSATLVDRTGGDGVENDKYGDGAYDGPIAEAQTKQLNFNLALPVGSYYIIAVANLGDVNGKSTYLELTDPNGKYYGRYSTLHELRSLKMTWDNNIRNNDQMLGFFDFADKHQSPNANSNFPLVNINRKNITIKSWLRRCASKITIDFDGSALRDNVYVYIKDVKIKNIVADCTLGFGKENRPGTTDIVTDYNNAAGNNTSSDKYKNYVALASLLNEDNNLQTITYGTEGFKNWPCITNGSPYLKYTEKNADGSETEVKPDLHTETAPALFFYENMQGKSPYPKVSTADPSTGKPIGSGNQDYDYDGVKFDGVPMGTYIEVTAHYISTNYDNVGDGDIKYRFMIGKDAIDNCDAERNSHFKLTLKFRGNANDYDWHIDYKDEEGFDAPNPWYVSYVYNHSSMMPFKYTPPKNCELVDLEAEIIENPWYPTLKSGGESDPPGGDDKYAYEDKSNRNRGNGFLALRSPMSETTTEFHDGTVVTNIDAQGKIFNWDKKGYESVKPNHNEYFFLGEAPSRSTIKKHLRVFFKNGKPTESTLAQENFTYMVEKDSKLNTNKYTFNIPLFTREKVLVKETGYTGNNPFVAKTRTAKLKLKATYINKITNVTDTVSKIIDVIQVKRLVNPKGIYRRAGNNQDFHVVLMERRDITDETFIKTVSDGPWRAEIIGDLSFAS